MDLKGKKALITGGTSGIGRAIAIAYAEAGADVTIFGTNEERAAAVMEHLQEAAQNPSQKVQFKRVNVSDHAQVKESMTRLLEEMGSIDILVNCAGITRDTLLMKMTEDDWNSVIDTNLKSVFSLCQAVIRPMMKAKSGKIINISSVIGLTGNPGQVNYAASKLGMLGFTRSLAKEVGSRGICVNCIAPGFIKTKMTDVLADAQKESILNKIPMGRLGAPEEIANLAVFLGSDKANYITGQVIAVDGGMIS